MIHANGDQCISIQKVVVEKIDWPKLISTQKQSITRDSGTNRNVIFIGSGKNKGALERAGFEDLQT